MIVGLIGKITKKEPTLLNVNVNGIIYEIFDQVLMIDVIDLGNRMDIYG